MKFSSDFNTAISDYFSFLQKKYPQKTILKLVGDRYKLSRVERSMLYRGISVQSQNTSRRGKLLKELSAGSNLVVDAFNQILTIASYLNGNVIFISSDGFLRDASEIHGKIFRSELLARSIELILRYCDSLNLNQLVFYIDQQVSNHEKVKHNLLNISSNYTIDCEIILSDEVDKKLKELLTGVIATSDSQIIEKSNLKIFDLAFHALRFHFNPKFFDLNNLVHKKL